MHSDVEDARRWAVDSGLADPARVAVLGGSWGGYLALGAVTAIATQPMAQQNTDDRRYAAVVAVVPIAAVGAANDCKAFRGDPLVNKGQGPGPQPLGNTYSFLPLP